MSVHQWLLLKVGYHTKDHGKDDHIGKKGKTFEECGVYTDKDKLYCCDRPSKSYDQERVDQSCTYKKTRRMTDQS